MNRLAILILVAVAGLSLTAYAAYTLGRKSGQTTGERIATDRIAAEYRIKLQSMILFVEAKDYARLTTFVKRELEATQRKVP